jgi:hypothetical protein
MHAAVDRKWEDKWKSEVAEWYDDCVGIPESIWPLWALMDAVKKH